MTKPEAFIFDLDGTLVDALPDIRANVNQALKVLGYEFELSLEETKPYIGGGARQLAASILDKGMDDPAIMALYHTFSDIYEQHPADFSKVFPGVMETLDTLKAHGIPMVCVTAKPVRARVQVLECLGLSSYLVYALSPEDGFARKPSPDMLLECCRVIGVKANDSVMVGDTRFDMEAGFNAGCHTVCYCEHGYQALPHVFEGRVMRLKMFTDLLSLVDG